MSRRSKAEPKIDVRVPLALVGGAAAALATYEALTRIEWATQNSLAGKLVQGIHDLKERIA